MRSCIHCKKKIEIKEPCVEIIYGEFEKDELGGIGFEKKTQIGYAHYECEDSKQTNDGVKDGG